MLKILQARLQQYMNHNFQMFKLVLEKAEPGPRPGHLVKMQILTELVWD